TKKQQQTGYISILTNPLTYATINVTLILLIWDGARLVYEGTLTQGQIIALVNYLLAILVELTKIVMQTVRLNRAWVSARRVAEVNESGSKSGEFQSLQSNTRVARDLKSTDTQKGEEPPVCRNLGDFRYPTAENDVLHDIS